MALAAAVGDVARCMWLRISTLHTRSAGIREARGFKEWSPVHG